jgi:hypothetical protein
VFLQVFRTYVLSVSSVFFLYVASVASRCFKSIVGECSGSPSGQCGLDFRRCFSPPRRLVAASGPGLYNSGQQQLEVTLGRVPPGGVGRTSACEMAREADFRRGRLDMSGC